MSTGTSTVEEMFASLDLSSPRSPDELRLLVETVDKRFRESNELRRESGLRHSRSQKKYFEEVRPLALLARHLFADGRDVVCEPNLEDAKNYDAIIRSSSCKKSMTPLYVEFTYAKDGYDESLRMEVLYDEGHVNLFGRVTRTGTRRARLDINIENEVVLRNDILKKQLELILERIDKKAAGQYTSAHILVVVFDDFTGFQSPDELAQLRSSIEASRSVAALKFRALYLLGSSGQSFLEFDLGTSSS